MIKPKITVRYDPLLSTGVSDGHVNAVVDEVIARATRGVRVRPTYSNVAVVNEFLLRTADTTPAPTTPRPSSPRESSCTEPAASARGKRSTGPPPSERPGRRTTMRRSDVKVGVPYVALDDVKVVVTEIPPTGAFVRGTMQYCWMNTPGEVHDIPLNSITGPWTQDLEEGHRAEQIGQQLSRCGFRHNVNVHRYDRYKQIIWTLTLEEAEELLALPGFTEWLERREAEQERKRQEFLNPKESS